MEQTAGSRLRPADGPRGPHLPRPEASRGRALYLRLSGSGRAWATRAYVREASGAWAGVGVLHGALTQLQATLCTRVLLPSRERD